ncbi:MAG: alcohol dehydrogenase [Gemmatales bacterium]|nr:MAG: alcohol dehydrogenase [Gemmatales bacterium]
MTALHRTISSLLFVMTASSVSAADWPQFLGPLRNGASPETGLLTTWPKNGPKVLWKVPGGEGYASIAVVGGRAFTLVQRGDDELVLALDVKDGKTAWTYRLGPAYKNQYGNGPRATPTVDGDRVFVQSVNGQFAGLDKNTGKVLWSQNLFDTFHTKNISWGLSASPLVDGKLVYVLPGLQGGVAALDKETGKVVWRTGKDKAAYASPIVATSNGTRLLIVFTAPGLTALNPATGQEYWKIPWKTEYDVNIATPLNVGDGLFVSSGEKVGCAFFKLTGKSKPTIVWQSKGPKSLMINYWANSVVHGEHLFGFDGEYNVPSNLRCLKIKTGRLGWFRERFGKANLALADGHLWITTAAGDVVVAAASPVGYQEKGRVRLLQKDRYATMPTIADKKLFVRDQVSIYCLDIAGK